MCTFVPLTRLPFLAYSVPGPLLTFKVLHPITYPSVFASLYMLDTYAPET